MRDSSTDYYFIDLFAGAGGLSNGLEQAGFKCLFSNEISSVYSETLAKNNSNTWVETEDICQIEPSRIRRGLQLTKGQLDLVVGGPPCQGFSINAPVRSKNDKRNHLFLNFLDFVGEFEPKVVLIENVPGIISFEAGNTVRKIISELQMLGYQCDIRILSASQYGVPQDRWRSIIIGNRLGKDPLEFFPTPSHRGNNRTNFKRELDSVDLTLTKSQFSKLDLLPCVNIWDAIGDLEAIQLSDIDVSYTTTPQSRFQAEARKGASHLHNHRSAKLGPINLERIQHVPQGGSWRDIPHELLPAGLRKARRSDHTKRYGRLHKSGIGSTILTKCDPHWGTFIHPTKDRVISVREAARIQSFPDTHIFYGSLTEQYQQVGNAVPPLLAKAIGLRIIEICEKKNIATISPFVQSQLNLAISQ